MSSNKAKDLSTRLTYVNIMKSRLEDEMKISVPTIFHSLLPPSNII